jgi:hypothetical protein
MKNVQDKESDLMRATDMVPNNHIVQEVSYTEHGLPPS